MYYFRFQYLFVTWTMASPIEQAGGFRFVECLENNAVLYDDDFENAKNLNQFQALVCKCMLERNKTAEAMVVMIARSYTNCPYSYNEVGYFYCIYLFMYYPIFNVYNM